MRRTLFGALWFLAGLAGMCLLWRGHMHWRMWKEERLQAKWDPASGVFSWGAGSIRMPHGFRHRRVSGIDTLMGEFVSANGLVVIQYDIGWLAGEHGSSGASTESIRSGSRVRLAKSGLAVSFPDHGCAYFRLIEDKGDGTATIRSIADSFAPRSSIPAMLVLPEALRSDCRYRLSGWL